MLLRVICALGVLLVATNVRAQQLPGKVPESVSFERNVVYGKGGDEELKLNVSRPKETKQPAPCIVVIHGGAWRAGNKDGHDNLTWMFAERGYVSATIGYRFCPKHTFPAQIEDAKCAVRYLRANAEKYGIDPQRIGAIGFSAGAHLSLMLGVMGRDDGLEGTGGWQDQPSQVGAVVSYFGPTDFLADDIPEVSKPLLKDFVGGTPQDKPEANKQASPITYVTKGDAPILFFQGTRDPLVPHTQTYRMIESLTQAGVPARAEILVGANHGWGGRDLQRTLAHTLEFFEENLKPVAVKPTP
jgi:acetyl esterase/lipase